MARLRVLALAAVVFAAACSKPQQPSSAAGNVPTGTAAPPAATQPAATGGTVAGRVAASGAAVVVLESKSPRNFPPQSEEPVMDQVGLTFGPELLVVRTGEPVEFRNSDDTLHNVNVKDEQTREQAFNVAIPTGASYQHRFGKDGFYRVGCDIHPAMAASVFAASTPFATVAAADGSFSFANVPTGDWTVVVYTGGKQLRKDIEVKRGVAEVTVE